MERIVRRGTCLAAALLTLSSCASQDTEHTAHSDPVGPQTTTASPIDPCNESWSPAKCSDLEAAIFLLISHADPSCGTLGWNAYDRLVQSGGSGWEDYLLMEFEEEQKSYYAITFAASGRTRYNTNFWIDHIPYSSTDLRWRLASLVAHEESHHVGWDACHFEDACSSMPLAGQCNH